MRTSVAYNLSQMHERADKQGIGRKTVDEVNKQACNDIQALSDFLGDKRFMHGHTITLVCIRLPM